LKNVKSLSIIVLLLLFSIFDAHMSIVEIDIDTQSSRDFFIEESEGKKIEVKKLFSDDLTPPFFSIITLESKLTCFNDSKIFYSNTDENKPFKPPILT